MNSLKQSIQYTSVLTHMILTKENCSYSETNVKTDQCVFAGKWKSGMAAHSMTLKCIAENDAVGMITGNISDQSGRWYSLTGRYRKYNKNYYLGLTSAEPAIVRSLTGVFLGNEQTIKASYQVLVRSNTVDIQKNTLTGDETYTRIK